METQTPKEKLQVWFDDPNTPQDAWKVWTFKEIETESGVSVTSILKYLPEIIGMREKNITGYAAFRQERQIAAIQSRKKGEPISDEDIERIQNLRKTKTIHEVVEITGFSATTVQRYSAKKPRKRK